MAVEAFLAAGVGEEAGEETWGVGDGGEGGVTVVGFLVVGVAGTAEVLVLLLIESGRKQSTKSRTLAGRRPQPMPPITALALDPLMVVEEEVVVRVVGVIANGCRRDKNGIRRT